MKLSNWLYKQPLKFAGLTFILSTIATFFYGGFFILRGIPMNPMPLMILIFTIFILCIINLIKKLPNSNLDQQSFIAIHNAQTILYFIGIFLTSVIFIKHAEQNIMNILLQSQPTFLSFFYLSLLTLFFLYLFGLYIANLYAKFRRIRSFGIPTYKIILSMPFGFSALWTPSYILSNTTDTKSTKKINPKWYKKFNNWILSNKTNCIISFILITIFSELIFNFNKMLLTLTFALIFGIWALQVGIKKFTKNINGAYTNMAIISNIILIIVISIFSLSSPTPTITPDTEITITETIQTTPGLSNE